MHAGSLESTREAKELLEAATLPIEIYDEETENPGENKKKKSLARSRL